MHPLTSAKCGLACTSGTGRAEGVASSKAHRRPHESSRHAPLRLHVRKVGDTVQPLDLQRPDNAVAAYRLGDAHPRRIDAIGEASVVATQRIQLRRRHRRHDSVVRRLNDLHRSVSRKPAAAVLQPRDGDVRPSLVVVSALARALPVPPLTMLTACGRPSCANSAAVFPCMSSSDQVPRTGKLRQPWSTRRYCRWSGHHPRSSCTV